MVRLGRASAGTGNEATDLVTAARLGFAEFDAALKDVREVWGVGGVGGVG